MVLPRFILQVYDFALEVIKQHMVYLVSFKADFLNVDGLWVKQDHLVDADEVWFGPQTEQEGIVPVIRDAEAVPAEQEAI